jgi:hypothetical protein
MPPEDGFGLDDKQVLAPALWPEKANPDPKDSISISEASVGVGAQDDVELMAKDQVFESQVASRSEQTDEAAEEQFEHPAGYPLVACSTLGFVLDGLLPPYSLSRGAASRFR